MSTNFTGATFANQRVTPSDDAIIRRAVLSDGILSGCELSYSGSTLTMAAGRLLACGRQFRHTAAQNWAVADATSGYARLLLTIDLSRRATAETFDQVVDTIEYASTIDSFPALSQEDINGSGTIYQIVACVVALGTAGITGIVSRLDKCAAVNIQQPSTGTPPDTTEDDNNDDEALISNATYFYNEGDTCEDMTGGWECIDARGTLTLGESDMTIFGIADGVYCELCLRTKNKIDLTGYTKIYFKLIYDGLVGDEYAAVGVTTSAEFVSKAAFSAYTLVEVSTDYVVYSVDVSNLGGEYYLAVFGFSNNTGANTGFRISKVCDEFGSESGNAAGLAELKDIRVGYDGTVYDTAGEAVRGQVQNLHTKIDKFAESLVYSQTHTAEGTSIDVKNAVSIDEARVTFQEYATKNYLPNNGVTTTKNGVTFTVQSDGRVALSGTATAEAEFFLLGDNYGNSEPISLKAGTYYLKGCPSGGAYTKYYLRLDIAVDGVSTTRNNYGDEAYTLTFNTDNSDTQTRLRITVAAGTNVDGLVFEPMLTTDPNAEYVPYSQSGFAGAAVTVKNNTNGNTETVAVNADGTVTGIPVYDDMTLSVASGYTLHLAYTTVSNSLNEAIDQVKAENAQQGEQITELSDRVAQLEETPEEEPENEAAPGVADYFVDEVSATINTITEKCGGTALVLNIVTDTHEDFSDSEGVRICNEMYANMKAVNDGVYCDALVHLGDSCNGSQTLYPDWLTVNKHLQSTRKRLSGCNDHSVMLVGNHDGIQSLNPNEKITYNAMYAYTRDYVKRPGAVPYGYMDFEDRKIRCVFLSTTTYNTSAGAASLGFGWEQFKWFADVACATDDGWQLLVLSHYSPYDRDLEEYYYANLIAKEIVKVLNAYTEHTVYTLSADLYAPVVVSVDFTTKTATKAVAWVCGHGHYDRITTDNTYITDFDLCCPIIQTACARLEQENEIPDDNADGSNDADVVTPARTTKTVTQDLWDTLVYRQDENKIYMVRFGAGEDREIALTD